MRQRWLQIVLMLITAVRNMLTDNAFLMAAAISYYALLSMLPLLLAVLAATTFVVDAEAAIEQIIDAIEELIPLQAILPEGEAQFRAIIGDVLRDRGTVGLISAGTLLWSGSRVFGAISRALNLAYDADETPGFLRRTIREVLMLLTLGVFSIMALASRAAIDLASRVLALLPAGEGMLVPLLRSFVPATLLLLAFFLIYRFVPRRRQHWQAALVGAAIATALFLLARPIFVGYVVHFSNHNVIYGSIGAVVVILLWIWIIALILLFGGEIASHTQEMLIEGRSASEVARRHAERAPDRWTRVRDMIATIEQQTRR